MTGRTRASCPCGEPELRTHPLSPMTNASSTTFSLISVARSFRNVVELHPQIRFSSHLSKPGKNQINCENTATAATARSRAKRRKRGRLISDGLWRRVGRVGGAGNSIERTGNGRAGDYDAWRTVQATRIQFKTVSTPANSLAPGDDPAPYWVQQSMHWHQRTRTSYCFNCGHMHSNWVLRLAMNACISRVLIVARPTEYLRSASQTLNWRHACPAVLSARDTDRRIRHTSKVTGH